MPQTALQKVIRLTGKAVGDFGLIRDGDRILVALSGGKDSWSLLYALTRLQAKAPIAYHVAAVTVAPAADGFCDAAMKERLSADGIEHTTIQGSILHVVENHLSPGTTPCSFCARLRRGMLYSFAAEHGWNKIALGHHMDDFVETLLMNLFFSGSIKGMSPYLESDDGRNTVIRPLVYVPERFTERASLELSVPILDCFCPYREHTGTRREWTKNLIRSLERDVPHVRSTVLSAMGRIDPRHLLQGSPEDAPDRGGKPPVIR
jgi:tRNA 2-thiocytidine biosynthesis protein TtcA